MRFVEPKNAEKQARALLFRTREQLVHQRTELVNVLRFYLYEYGHVLPIGIASLRRIKAIVADTGNDLPDLVRDICSDLLRQIAEKTARIDALMKRIKSTAEDTETARRLQTMPGVGPVTALAVEAFAPPLESFQCGRDFAAWLGLVPRQNSTGGKQRLGRVTKAGQADIRRLLIVGAMSRLTWLGRKSIREGSWLARMLGRKPKMLVAIALANKMARAIWAMLTRGEDYRNPVRAVAQAVDALAGLHGPPALIVADTLARNFGPGDENSTSEMGAFVAAMDDLKARYPGCAVLIVHHSGHAEKHRARGAMALKGALDFEYLLKKDGMALTLANTKMKDAEQPADLFFRLAGVDLGDGVKGAVLKAADAPERCEKVSAGQRLALDTYKAASLKHGIGDDRAFRGVHLDQWREVFYRKHTGDMREAKKKAFQRARDELIRVGRMEVANDIYLICDPAIQLEISAHRDSRDMSRPVPGQTGQMPKGMSLVPQTPPETDDRHLICHTCPERETP